MRKPKLYGIITSICLSLILLTAAVHRMISEPSIVLALFTASVIALVSILVSILIYSTKPLKPKETALKQEVDIYPLFHHMHEEHNLILTESELAEIIHIVQYIQNQLPPAKARGFEGKG